MQFLVIAHDGTDEGALDRRMAAREAHLANAQKLKAEGKLVMAGAMLSEEGKMIGSTLFMDLPDREALDACLAGDPYSEGGVWQKFEVTPVKLAKL